MASECTALCTQSEIVVFIVVCNNLLISIVICGGVITEGNYFTTD